MSMTPFVIDLRPSVPKAKVAALAACALMSIVACFMAWRLVGMRAEIRAAEALIARTTETIKALESRQRAAKTRPPYLDAMNELVQISTFPLNEVFDALERVDVPGVRLVELKVDASQRQATAWLEAASAEALQAYLEGATAVDRKGGWQLQEITSGGRSGGGAGVLPTAQISGSLPVAQAAAMAVGSLRVRMVWMNSGAN